MPMTSSRPYLIRALYEWIVDNQSTPYLLVDVRRGDVAAPMDYADDGKLVLNIAPHAVQALHMGNDAIEFQARFGGVAQSVSVPTARVLAVYARENGEGMLFGDSDESDPSDADPAPDGGGPGDDDPDGGPGPGGPGGGGRPNLRVVK